MAGQTRLGRSSARQDGAQDGFRFSEFGLIFDIGTKLVPGNEVAAAIVKPLNGSRVELWAGTGEAGL
jgi:hypothetical protein